MTPNVPPPRKRMVTGTLGGSHAELMIVRRLLANLVAPRKVSPSYRTESKDLRRNGMKTRVGTRTIVRQLLKRLSQSKYSRVFISHAASDEN